MRPTWSTRPASSAQASASSSLAIPSGSPASTSVAPMFGRRPDDDVVRPEPLAELDRARRPERRLLSVVAVLVEACEVRIGAAQLGPRRERLEQRDRILRVLHGLRDQSGAPADVGSDPQCVCFVEVVPETAIHLDRLRGRLERLVVLVGHDTRHRRFDQELGPALRRQMVAVAKRPGVLGGGLSMRAQCRCPLGRRGSEAQDGLGVTGGIGMVREPRQVETLLGDGGEGLECSPVQREASGGRKRLLDGAACELVAERNGSGRGHEHSRGQAFVDTVRGVRRERVEELELGVRRDHRDRLQDGAGVRAEVGGVCEDRVPHAVGNPVSARGEYLGDEEGVSGRRFVEPVGIDAVRPSELGDGRRR